MTPDDLMTLLATMPATPIVVTDTRLDAPGPFIVFANDAFAAMVETPVAALIGRSPRGFQGARTEPRLVRALSRAIRATRATQAVITNHRGAGEAYLCAVEIHPVVDRDGRPVLFAGFEREVVRRRGRPSAAGRFEVLDASARFPSETDPARFGL